jgi:hypothetical protein
MPACSSCGADQAVCRHLVAKQDMAGCCGECAVGDTHLDLCSMCEQAPATTTWGFTVCQPCADWLSTLDGDVKAMEAADPELAEAGRQVEDAFRQYREANP